MALPTNTIIHGIWECINIETYRGLFRKTQVCGNIMQWDVGTLMV